MKKRALMLTIFALILTSGAAVAEEGPSMRGPEGHAMMGQGGMMGCGMMGRGGMMGGGMMGRGVAMRFIFALMDSDGDGPSRCKNFKPLTRKSSRRWTPTRTALLPSRRYKPSCGGPVNLLRRNMNTNASSETTAISGPSLVQSRPAIEILRLELVGRPSPQAPIPPMAAPVKSPLRSAALLV